ncbi:hypothetical protein DQ384_26090 [Sphaerisporangium album]|uniref:Uncharacterized protein n=1 Tax=Sphaerisporangium album TaxID=509200 RepID=A0A367F9Z1_9ACTN|nr:hypothetical protein [Sphaerisporangium album]RCG27193.1 hypothetical protein DQ384_26090 [Sphaerisporangium album]
MIPRHHGSVDSVGHRTENLCPCPQEACGLVDPAHAEPDCIQHGRNHPPQPTAHGHHRDQCPGVPDPGDVLAAALRDVKLGDLAGAGEAFGRRAGWVLVDALRAEGYRLVHRTVNLFDPEVDDPDGGELGERAAIAADLHARAAAIEDSNGNNHDWLAEILAEKLPTLAIGGAIQDDPRNVARVAYRGMAFIITAPGKGRSSSDAPARAPEAPQAPVGPEAGIPGSLDGAETITAPRGDHGRAYSRETASDVIRDLKNSYVIIPKILLPSPAALDLLADWLDLHDADSKLPAPARQDELRRWAEAIRNADAGVTPEAAEATTAPSGDRPKVYTGEPQATPPVVERPPTPVGATLERSHLAAAVQTALADAGHTAATDSETGDGYHLEHLAGVVMVTLIRGETLTKLPWAPTQRQTLGPWADTLRAAGFEVATIGGHDAPNALHVLRLLPAAARE